MNCILWPRGIAASKVRSSDDNFGQDLPEPIFDDFAACFGHVLAHAAAVRILLGEAFDHSDENVEIAVTENFGRAPILSGQKTCGFADQIAVLSRADPEDPRAAVQQPRFSHGSVDAGRGVETSVDDLMADVLIDAGSTRRQRSGASPQSSPRVMHASIYTIGGYVIISRRGTLMHTVREKQKLIARVRRIRGQVEAIEKSLVEEKGCYEVLQTVTAARGALNGLVAEMIEDHVRFHVLDPEEKLSSKRSRAAEELIDVVRSYVK